MESCLYQLPVITIVVIAVIIIVIVVVVVVIVGIVVENIAYIVMIIATIKRSMRTKCFTKFWFKWISHSISTHWLPSFLSWCQWCLSYWVWNEACWQSFCKFSFFSGNISYRILNGIAFNRFQSRWKENFPWLSELFSKRKLVRAWWFFMNRGSTRPFC